MYGFYITNEATRYYYQIDALLDDRGNVHQFTFLQASVLQTNETGEHEYTYTDIGPNGGLDSVAIDGNDVTSVRTKNNAQFDYDSIVNTTIQTI